MPSFKLSSESIRRISTAFKRYQKIRSLILRNVDEYISDFMNFKGTEQDRDEYLERKYMSQAPKENYLIADGNGNIMFYVREIALLTGRDTSSISRTLSQMERSEGWYSKLIPLRKETKSANNNTIYAYDRKIFDLIIDYREHKYLERIKNAGGKNYSEAVRYWKYLKKLERYRKREDSKNRIAELQDDDSEITELPEIPPVSWKDVISIIGSKLFSIRTDMIFAFVFAVTFGIARRWPVVIPVFAAVPAALLAVFALMLRHRAEHSEIFAEAGALMTLLAIFWGVNLTMENGIYTPGGTVMNLTTPEPAIKLDVTRGEYAGWDNSPLVFFVNIDNEAEVREIFYRTDSDTEYKSSGLNYTGVNLWLTPDIKTDIITLYVKYTDMKDKEHGPYKFTFDVEKERFNSGKNALLNDPDIIDFSQRGQMTLIHTLLNDTVKAVHYGINSSKPDRIYIPDFSKDYERYKSNIVDEVISRVNEDVDFVSLYTEFTDGTSSDIHIKKTERGRLNNRTPSLNEAVSL
ncbi:MAG: hypothetical protein IJ697_05400 [Synergistaceae bacterium]|nr:hypothetical protein [Synergistaceae bacterium]